MSLIKKNKNIFAIGAITIIFILVIFYSFNVNQENSFLLDITEHNTYEMNGRKIVFLDLPEDEPETVISNYYLLHITGEYEKLNYLYPSISDTIENLLTSYKNREGYKFIKVLDINSLDKQELENATWNGKPLKDAKIFFSNKTYEEKIKEEGLNDYRVVHVKAQTQYTDESIKKSPQYPDGLIEKYFIVASNDKGSYIIMTENMR